LQEGREIAGREQDVMKVREFYRNLPRLETARLILRTVTMGDVEDIFVYSSDEEVTRFLRWGPHRTREETERYVREVLREYKEGADGPWGVECRETGR
jgi:ribosomal-protein-alanine N-acetyltransferase